MLKSVCEFVASPLVLRASGVTIEISFRRFVGLAVSALLLYSSWASGQGECAVAASGDHAGMSSTMVSTHHGPAMSAQVTSVSPQAARHLCCGDMLGSECGGTVNCGISTYSVQAGAAAIPRAGVSQVMSGDAMDRSLAAAAPLPPPPRA